MINALGTNDETKYFIHSEHIKLINQLVKNIIKYLRL
jgi:hypothetical protein